MLWTHQDDQDRTMLTAVTLLLVAFSAAASESWGGTLPLFAFFACSFAFLASSFAFCSVDTAPHTPRSIRGHACISQPACCVRKKGTPHASSRR